MAFIARQTPDTAAAKAVLDWAAARAHIRVAGGTGLTYPTLTMSADSGRSRSRFRGVLLLSGTPDGERPFLEIRIKRLCRTPPYNRAEPGPPDLAGLQRVR